MTGSFVRVSAWVVVFAAVVGAQVPNAAQTLPRGLEEVAGPVASNAPFGTTSDTTQQWVYDSSEFAAQGPITITRLWVRPSPVSIGWGGVPTVYTIPAWSFPSVEITLASSVNDYSLAGSGGQSGHSPVFASNLGADATVVRSGPWTGGPVPGVPGQIGTWIPLDLQAPFTYDPTLGLDFIVQIRRCGVTSYWGTGGYLSGQTNYTATGNGGNAYRSFGCAATTASLAGQTIESVPIVRIDYVDASAPPREFELDRPEARMDLNEVFASPLWPAVATVEVGVAADLSIDSVNVGNAWDIGYGLAPLVPRTSGGLVTSGGEVLNLDLADPSFALFHGGFSSPPFAAQSMPVTANAPLTLSLQLAVIDPAAVAGFHLSQATTLAAQ